MSHDELFKTMNFISVTRWREMPNACKRVMLNALCLWGLSACGGANSENETVEPSSGQEQTLNDPVPPVDGRLVAADSAKAFAEYYKLTLEEHNRSFEQSSELSNDSVGLGSVDLLETSDVAMAESAVLASTSPAGDFSTTYTQEFNVDESDLMKFDGQRLFIAVQPEYQYSCYPDHALAVRTSLAPELCKGDIESNAEIRVMSVQSTPPSSTEVNRIDLLTNDRIDGMYLHEDQLTTLSKRSSWGWGWQSYDGWRGGEITVEQHDISDVENINDGSTLQIEGYLIGSRRVGDELVLVTRMSPELPNYHWAPSTAEQRAENKNLIEAFEVADLLPKMSLNGAAPQLLLPPEACLLSSELTNQLTEAQSDAVHRYRPLPQIVTIVKINLQDFSDQEALCTVANSDGFYMSQEAAYLYSGAYNYEDNSTTTTIHKFDISSETLSYRASGEVPGSLGWNKPEYRMGEKAGDLVIVTQQEPMWIALDDMVEPAVVDILEDEVTPVAVPIVETSNEIETRDERAEHRHLLSVLRDNGEGELALVSQLPNKAQPTPIGKPGESIYAVRILKDLAYIVTFRRIDPLYVVDLTDTNRPFIAGELEIPGFSDFLHPVSDDLLLGVGYSADNWPNNSLKLSLFDVSDASEPKEVDVLEIGVSGTYSPVNYNPKAFTTLRLDDSLTRVAFPLSRYEIQGDSDYPSWVSTGLTQFEVQQSGSPSSATIDQVGVLVRHSSEDDEVWESYLDEIERSVILDDSVHYISGEHVWSGSWSSPDDLVGPQ